MKWLGGILSIGTFVVLYAFERKQSLRRQIEQKEISTAREFAIAFAAGLAMNFIEKPVTNKWTRFVKKIISGC
jgi:hypothetical protein